MTAPADRIIRTMTDDGAFRVMALDATETVRAICEAQVTPAVALQVFAEALMGVVLIRETMAPMLRVELLMRDRLGNQLVGDAWPEGETRGMLTVTDEVLGFYFGEGALMQVIRVMPRGEQHEGIIEPREDGGVAGAVQDYFLKSEQVESMVGLAAIVEDDRVVAAGGYVVQLLPELTDPPLVAMRKRLAALDLEQIVRSGGERARALTAAILGNEEFTQLADSPVSFACRCTPQKVVRAVALLEVDELRELADKDETISVRCDYCRTEYRMHPPQIREVLARREAE